MGDNPTMKGKVKMNRSIPTEYLLNNIIDKGFQAALLPLRIPLYFCLIFNFRITNNFITPESNTSLYIKSVLGYFILLMIHCIRFVCLNYYLENFTSGAVNFLLCFDLVYFSLTSIMVYVDNARNGNDLVELVIKLQNVINFLHIDKEPLYFKHRVQNWLSVLSLISSYLVNCYFSKNLGFFGMLVNFLLIASTLVYDFSIVNVTRTVVTIKTVLKAWIDIMEEHVRDNIETMNEIQSDGSTETPMFDAYTDIMRSFRLCNNVYKFSFTCFAFQTFTLILLTLETILELSRIDAGRDFVLYVVIISTLWNVKNVILVATLSIACENFYIAVKDAESSCAQILNGEAPAGLRMTCKNVFRLNRAVIQKLSAFGLFELDAAFPLRLLSAIMVYTVVLLQFTFL